MRILIVKTSAIGDVIQTFPVIEYLRARFPESTIHWAVEKGCKSLVTSHPLVDAALEIDTKKWRKKLWSKEARGEIQTFVDLLRQNEYDIVFDLQGNTKSGFITACARGKDKVGFGSGSVTEKPNLLATTRRFEVPLEINVRLRYLSLVQQAFNDTGSFEPRGVTLKLSSQEEEQLQVLVQKFPEDTNVHMVCFGSKWRNKQLPEKTLVEYLKSFEKTPSPFFLFIYGSSEEEKMAKHLESSFPDRSMTVGRLSLPLWQALMTKVDLVIAMDSAALHLCGTTATPSFSFFGPSSSTIYKPVGPQHLSIQGSCPYGRTFVHRCPILRKCPTGACLRELSQEQIAASQSRDDTPQSQSLHGPSRDLLAGSSLCKK